MRRPLIAGLFLSVLAASAPAPAALRDDIAQTAFGATDKKQALAQLQGEIAQADALLAANPGDREAMLQRGVAIGYRAKLTNGRADAVTSRQIFEALARANPRDAEVQLTIAGWHLDTLAMGFLATTVLGAKREVAIPALDRAVALGRDRPFILGAAALLTIRDDDKAVAKARALAEAAQRAPATTGLDRLLKRNAGLLLVPLAKGDGRAAKALAKTLLPFGRIG